MNIIFYVYGVTLTQFDVIMNFAEEQNEHEIYFLDDLTVCLFIPEPDCCFKYFSMFN